MLIQKTLDQGDIVSIKLLTGEEVLGRYVSETWKKRRTQIARKRFAVKTDDDET